MRLSMYKVLLTATSLLIGTPLFAQNQDAQKQGNCGSVEKRKANASPKKQELFQASQMPKVAAYNAPAEINIGAPGNYDIFFTGNFLYWQPLLDNLTIGIATRQTLEELLLSAQGKYIFVDYDYKPGFKAGVGMNFSHDHWTGYIEYTRFHGRHTGSFNASEEYPLISASQGNLFQLAHFGQVYTSAHTTYTCNLDFVDGVMERACYVGQKLVLHPSFGVRAAWIYQKIQTRYNSNVQDLTVLAETGGFVSVIQPNGELDTTNTAPSWAIGPRTGVKMDWLFGDGFRFCGNCFGDILYTHYSMEGFSNAVTRQVQGALAPGQVLPLSAKSIEINSLRTHVDLEAGFGWGTYFANNQWHVDLAVTYDFQVFFNQNTISQHLDSTVLAAVLTEKGNLYTQGLNVSARFDF